MAAPQGNGSTRIESGTGSIKERYRPKHVCFLLLLLELCQRCCAAHAGPDPASLFGSQLICAWIVSTGFRYVHALQGVGIACKCAQNVFTPVLKTV